MSAPHRATEQPRPHPHERETRPIVSVVIPNLNGSSMLLRAIASVHDSDLAGQAAETIVVDNGSVDDSLDRIADLPGPVKVIRNRRNLGYAAACNRGAAAASGDFLLLLNSDAVLLPGSLPCLISTALRDSDAAVWQPVLLRESGGLDSAGSSFTSSGFLWHHTRLPRPEEPPFPVFSAKGACVLIRADVFRRLKGFDPRFFAYFEDSDLCWRVRLAGWEVRVVPQARVLHKVGATTTRFFKPHQIDYLSFRNRLRTIVCNSGRATALRVLPLHIAACLGTVAAFALSRKPRSAVAILRALWWPIPHWRSVRQTRREVQAQRVVSDEEVFRPDLVAPLTLGRATHLLRAYLPQW